MTGPESSIDLAPPKDDGAADHLPGNRFPAIELPASDGTRVRLDQLPARSVVFVYPAIGGPGREELLDEWTAIPGARGCTPEACSFRDGLPGFDNHRVDVFGLSCQRSSIQREQVEQLALPCLLLSDDQLRLSESPGLPTFAFHGRRYFTRLTLIVAQGMIEAVLYPVFPPEEGAAQALCWLGEHPRAP